MIIVDEVLKHYGVKGMKWGVIRSKKPSAPKTKVKTRINVGSKKKLSFDGAILPLPAAAVIGTGMAINNARVKRKIAKGLGKKVKDFDKSSLETASYIARRYKDVTISANGKTYNTSKK